MTRRRIAIIAATTAALLGFAVPSWAYFTASTSSTISAGATALSVVTNATATATDANDVTVSWTKPSSPSNPSGTVYTVTSSPGTKTCTSGGTSCVVSGLTANTPYSFTIEPAIPASSWTGPSASASAKTLASASASGLGITITGGTGSVGTCGPVSANYTCNITGTAKSGSVSFSVSFLNSNGTPVVYSSTQSSTINGSGTTSPSVSILANQSTSTSSFTVNRPGNSSPTATLTFGTTFTLVVNVTGPNS